MYAMSSKMKTEFIHRYIEINLLWCYKMYVMTRQRFWIYVSYHNKENYNNKLYIYDLVTSIFGNEDDMLSFICLITIKKCKNAWDAKMHVVIFKIKTKLIHGMYYKNFAANIIW